MLRKFKVTFFAVSLFMVGSSRAPLIQNEFEQQIGVLVSYAYGEVYYAIERGMRASMGSEEITSIGVVNKRNLRVEEVYEKTPLNGILNELGTSIAADDPRLSSIRELLTKVPTATMRIIPDPTQKKRPMIVLPTLEQLKKEMEKVPAQQGESKELAELAAVKADLAKVKKALSDIKQLSAAY